MVLIYLPDPGWQPADEEYWWSILEPDDHRPRPAYITVAICAKSVAILSFPNAHRMVP